MKKKISAIAAMLAVVTLGFVPIHMASADDAPPRCGDIVRDLGELNVQAIPGRITQWALFDVAPENQECEYTVGGETRNDESVNDVDVSVNTSDAGGRSTVLDTLVAAEDASRDWSPFNDVRGVVHERLYVTALMAGPTGATSIASGQLALTNGTPVGQPPACP